MRNTKKPIEDLNQALQREVDTHKWIESERAKKNLNGEAIEGWYKNHFKAWLANEKKKIMEEIAEGEALMRKMEDSDGTEGK